jgi:hypothetical protein
LKTVAFGPEKDVPSWNWVGFDTSRELAKYYDVLFYSSIESPPDADVILVIKQRPSDKFISRAKNKNQKIIYLPIDFYNDERQLKKDGEFFKKCDLILCHSERMIPLIKVYNPKVNFIEHNNKYMLPEMAEYKDKGFILWVGGCQYIAYLAHWLRRNRLPYEVKILSDCSQNDRARKAVSIYAHEIKFDFSIKPDATSILGCEIYPWSEKLQYEMMTECKAAIDIKMTERFNQYHKPPTKAQKYVASGIPFAINSDSYSAEYFKKRGFDVCVPTDSRRWFSKAYWEETQAFGERLRKLTNIETVGLSYKQYIDGLL